jgi:uncharacterized glyoxalase superfamily protein PhnB
MLSPILSCTDVDASIGYYTQKLGFEHAWSMPPNAAGKTEFACVKLGDAEILLGVVEGFVTPEDLNKRGIGVQLYIALPDSISIDALYERAHAAGANITHAIEDRDWGERSFNVRDGDGYSLMLAQAIKKRSDSGNGE